MISNQITAVLSIVFNQNDCSLLEALLQCLHFKTMIMLNYILFMAIVQERICWKNHKNAKLGASIVCLDGSCTLLPELNQQWLTLGTSCSRQTRWRLSKDFISCLGFQSHSSLSTEKGPGDSREAKGWLICLLYLCSIGFKSHASLSEKKTQGNSCKN